ncbi:MAG: HAD hydrolase-like protein [Desulfovibrionales bacterium]
MRTSSFPLNIVFDLDGTLSDPAEGITRCLNHALNGLGVPERDPCSLAGYIGPPLNHIFADLLGTCEDGVVFRAVHLFRKRYWEEGYRENILYPGVCETLLRLRASGHQLHIATTKRTDVALRTTEYLGISHLFESILGGGMSRTKPDLLREIRSGKTRPMAMIGDRSFDMRAGREVGARCIGALWGFGSKQELLESGAEVLCIDIENVSDCLCVE